MRVLAYDPLLPAGGVRRVQGSTPCEPGEACWRRSDAVSLHLPLSAETHNLLDAAALARMKPTAYLINTARGGLVDEAALYDAALVRAQAGGRGVRRL
jgi:phosphoglycerate dehydrogenase-like enzyme